MRSPIAARARSQSLASAFAGKKALKVIPTTTFDGRQVAVFGLGGSGLASCRALAAGGAEVIACDDNAASMGTAAQAGFHTADLRHVNWSTIAALVLAPGVPLTHPVPHWSVALARIAA